MPLSLLLGSLASLFSGLDRSASGAGMPPCHPTCSPDASMTGEREFDSENRSCTVSSLLSIFWGGLVYLPVTTRPPQATFPIQVNPKTLRSMRRESQGVPRWKDDVPSIGLCRRDFTRLYQTACLTAVPQHLEPHEPPEPPSRAPNRCLVPETLDFSAHSGLA